MRLSFVGAGKMAEAMVAGVIQSKRVSPERICVQDINGGRLDFFRREFGCTVESDTARAVDGSDICVMAVKPQNFEDVFAKVPSHARTCTNTRTPARMS